MQGQFGRHFADSIFKFSFLCELFCILIYVSLTFISKIQLAISQHWFRHGPEQARSCHLHHRWLSLRTDIRATPPQCVDAFTHRNRHRETVGQTTHYRPIRFSRGSPNRDRSKDVSIYYGLSFLCHIIVDFPSSPASLAFFIYDVYNNWYDLVLIDITRCDKKRMLGHSLGLISGWINIWHVYTCVYCHDTNAYVTLHVAFYLCKECTNITD